MGMIKKDAKAGLWALRLLSITLSVMLIVTMIPVSGIGRVYAEPEPDTDLDLDLDLDIQEVPVDDVLDVETDPFSAFWDESSQTYLLPSGTYTMTEDFSAQGYIFVPRGETVIIDLNGFTLKRELEKTVEKGYVIENVGTLTIKDSSNATGKITGGSITGNSANRGGGIINSGTMSISDAVITDNVAVKEFLLLRLTKYSEK